MLNDPKNQDLVEAMLFCRDKSLVTEAFGVLRLNHPSNDNLIRLICYSSSSSLDKNELLSLFFRNRPTSEQLKLILEDSLDSEINIKVQHFLTRNYESKGFHRLILALRKSLARLLGRSELLLY